MASRSTRPPTRQKKNPTPSPKVAIYLSLRIRSTNLHDLPLHPHQRQRGPQVSSPTRSHTLVQYQHSARDRKESSARMVQNKERNHGDYGMNEVI